MKYVIITSAYNEESNIGKTLSSVVAQSEPPIEWVIISDGSTDGTDRIIEDYASRHSYIKYYRREKDGSHSYGSKVAALNWGLSLLHAGDWDYFGILDADISFPPDYFLKLEDHFLADETLGIAGGRIIEVLDDGEYPQRIAFDSSVAGAVQLFRRECWEVIGKFLPLPHGGEDAAAEIIARSHGWRVHTLSDLPVKHYGMVGKGSGNLYRAKYRNGINCYQLGYHPLFQFARCIGRILDRPAFIGAFLDLWGYAMASMRGYRRELPPETVAFLRSEQIEKLIGMKGGRRNVRNLRKDRLSD